MKVEKRPELCIEFSFATSVSALLFVIAFKLCSCILTLHQPRLDTMGCASLLTLPYANHKSSTVT